VNIVTFSKFLQKGGRVLFALTGKLYFMRRSHKAKSKTYPPPSTPTKLLRRNVEKGLPCGSEQFVASLEKLARRVLWFRPQGRPVNNKG